MKKELKELVSNAPIVKAGLFTEFLFISNGKYNGFWGKNGYNNIIVLARENVKDGEWKKLCDSIDVFTIFGKTESETMNFDIPSAYGVLRMWCSKPVKIDYQCPTSSLFGYTQKRENNET